MNCRSNDSCCKHLNNRCSVILLFLIQLLLSKCSQMLVNRWSRLCSLCSRVVYSSRGRRAGWRTLTGHSRTQVQRWGTVAPRRLYHSDLGDLYKKESVQRYIQQLMEEFRDLSKKLQHAYLSESDRKVLSKKHTELLPLANVFEEIEQALKDLEEVLSLLHSEYFVCLCQ